MKKPRLFIGSSVEGLSIAYAIQENLSFTSEVTVWSQGTFELSDTTIESLVTLIENTDFGIFVFTPDDVTLMRGKKNLTIRDNVLFELGLFIGKIGRKRSFIVLPDNSDLHLPSDLLGITPGKYEANRTDGNLKAATGSFSNKVREIINKLGFLNDPDLSDSTTTLEKIISLDSVDWEEEIYTHKNYPKALLMLKKKLRNTKDEDDKVILLTHICFCELHINYKNGLSEYEKVINAFPSNNIGYKAYAQSLLDNSSMKEAIKVLDKGIEICNRKIGLTIMKADCLWLMNEKEEAIKLLTDSDFKNDALVVNKLISYYTENKDLKSVMPLITDAFKANPKDSHILEDFASTAFEVADYELSTYLYTELLKLTPNDSEANGALGNSYYHLQLYNAALNAYEKANTIASESEPWVLQNIGNTFKQRGFYNKAEEYLTKASKLNDKSEYGLARLSEVYKSIEEEKKKIAEILVRGKAKLFISVDSN